MVRLAARRQSGFTLVELLVTITIMALMTVMSWRGLDGMLRARDLIQSRTNDVLALQTGLTQWTVDLDNIAETQVVSPVEYDGSVLRLTRRDAVTPAEGLRVVAWTRRQADGRGYWVRWQSLHVRTREDLVAAWQKAQQWGREPRPEDLAQEIPLAGIDLLQLFYYRDNAWSNPQSSAQSTSSTPGAPPAAINPLMAAPEGVRLVLSLSEGGPYVGNLTRDWVRPVLGGGKT
ncbi:MAG: prepilin-type N-terminal cleavage/methylation domain-containing protein [Pseudomonadota bacterium]